MSAITWQQAGRLVDRRSPCGRDVTLSGEPANGIQLARTATTWRIHGVFDPGPGSFPLPSPAAIPRLRA